MEEIQSEVEAAVRKVISIESSQQIDHDILQTLLNLFFNLLPCLAAILAPSLANTSDTKDDSLPEK